MWCLDYRHIVVDMYNLYGESIKCITHAESKTNRKIYFTMIDIFTV